MVSVSGRHQTLAERIPSFESSQRVCPCAGCAWLAIAQRARDRMGAGEKFTRTEEQHRSFFRLSGTLSVRSGNACTRCGALRLARLEHSHPARWEIEDRGLCHGCSTERGACVGVGVCDLPRLGSSGQVSSAIMPSRFPPARRSLATAGAFRIPHNAKLSAQGFEEER